VAWSLVEVEVPLLKYLEGLAVGGAVGRAGLAQNLGAGPVVFEHGQRQRRRPVLHIGGMALPAQGV
jgi:hypothetical protein